MEWQGVVITDLYYNSNNIVSEYFTASVLVMPDASLYVWDEVCEAPVYDGVLQPAIAEPWMFTNVDLGIPLDQQQVSADVNQGISGGIVATVPASYFQGGIARIRASANCTFGWSGGTGASCIGTSVWSGDALKQFVLCVWMWRLRDWVLLGNDLAINA